MDALIDEEDDHEQVCNDHRNQGLLGLVARKEAKKVVRMATVSESRMELYL